MEELKELVEKFLEYTCTISICDSELYEKYYDKLSQCEIDYLSQLNKLDLEIDKMVKADILYDFIFNLNGIKEQMENDIYSYSKDSGEYKYIIKIYKEIQKVFPNFKIEKLEEVI